METKTLEKKVRPVESRLPEDPVRDEIRDAIGEGFDEYRRRIAAIRAAHGKSIRKSILN